MENNLIKNYTAYNFTIGQEFNGWIVDEVYEKSTTTTKKYYFLKSHCKLCNAEKWLRADKRNSYSTCDCQNKLIKNLEKSWEKVKNSSIFESKEEFFNKYKDVKDLQVIKFQKNFKTEYFIGSKEEYSNYKKNKESDVNNNIISGNICPNCKKSHIYINKCEHCGTVFNEHFKFKNKIEAENNCYCEVFNYLSCTDNENEKIYLPIDSITSFYIQNNEKEITRIGLTRITDIDYKKQGIIGDFQGIDENGKTFIIDNVFQSFKNDSKMFKILIKKPDYSILINDQIPSIEPNQTYFYFVLKKDSIPYSLYIYKNNRCLKHIKHIICMNNININMATRQTNIIFEDYNGNQFLFDTEEEIIKEYGTDINFERKDDIKIRSEIFLRAQKYVPIYINRTLFKSNECLYYYLSNLGSLNRIENEFADDNTENFFINIDSKDFKKLDFIYYLYLKKSDNLTHFGSSLNIYGYPLFRILKRCIYENKVELKEYFKSFQNIFDILDYEEYQESRNQYFYEKIIKKLLNKYDCNELELVKIMIEKYGIAEVLNLNFHFAERRNEGNNKKYFLEKENLIIHYNKKNILKWKAEYTLFKLLKFYFNDAVYQYYFGNISVDIYIPSRNIAFEYQGEEHYRPVKQFGGFKEFKERQIRDSIKKDFLKSKNIKLIEWKYDELINKMVLDEKLKDV